MSEELRVGLRVRRVRRVEADYGIPAELVRRWGHLTETIQVQGAIALAAVERTGLDVDRQFLHTLRAGLQQRRDSLVQWFEEQAPEVLVRKNRPSALVTASS